MTDRPVPEREKRGQTTLPALAVALVVLTAVTGLALLAADTAIRSADRTPRERHAAASVADSLVAADGPLAARANVLNGSRVDAFGQSDLRSVVRPAGSQAIAVTLDDETLARTGDSSGGATIERLVLVERHRTRRINTNLGDGRRVTIPRRTSSATITIDAPNGTDVWTVRAGDRVLLHNASGLNGTFDVSLVRTRTTTLVFKAAGDLSRVDVTVAYDAPRTRKATLAVTVDA
ncbi:MAG: hypothetical protein ABEH35_04590 [Haloarculaceae archaeon]